MSNKNNLIEEMKLLETIQRSSLYATRDGCVKCWRGVTYEHFMTMAAVCWKIANNGYKIFTEVEFKNGGRADIVAIRGRHGYIIEILHTESEERFSSKKDVYPDDFFMISVKTKDFDINKFDL
jgi:hypothetical protein